MRNELMFSLREAFKMLCRPDMNIPYLLVGIGTAKDGSKKIMTVLTDINSNPWQDTDVIFLGSVDLSRLKQGDADCVLAEYEKKLEKYLDGGQRSKTMIKTYADAVDMCVDFHNKIGEMDLALCRQGGHPDVAMNVTDKFLQDELLLAQNAVRRLRYILLEKEHNERKQEEKKKCFG